jgi:ATP sulfurylase
VIWGTVESKVRTEHLVSAEALSASITPELGIVVVENRETIICRACFQIQWERNSRKATAHLEGERRSSRQLLPAAHNACTPQALTVRLTAPWV